VCSLFLILHPPISPLFPYTTLFRSQAWASIGAMGRLVFHKRPLTQVVCLRLQRQLPRKSSVFCLKSMLPGTAWLGSYHQPAANEEVTMSHRSDTKTSAQDQPAWHTMEAVEVEQRLQSAAAGLSEAEAVARRSVYGENRLAPPKTRGPLMRLLAQFHNILLYVMLASAVVTAALGHWVDTGVLLGAVVINAKIGRAHV